MKKLSEILPKWMEWKKKQWELYSSENFVTESDSHILGRKEYKNYEYTNQASIRNI